MTRASRFATLAVVAVLAALAILIGLDRYAQLSRGLQRLSPGFGPYVQQMRTAAALTDGNVAAAQEAARATVVRAPLEPYAASFLATTQLMRGRTEAATTIFTAAARLGWRDQVTQRWALTTAIDAQDASDAALRVDALARTGVPLQSLEPALQWLEARADGRAALSRQLDQRPEWAAAYVDNAGAALQASGDNRVRIIESLQRQAPALTDEHRAIATWSIYKRSPQRALEFATRFEPVGQDRQSVRQSFTSGLGSAPGPFEWRLAAGAYVDDTATGGGPALHVRTDVNSGANALLVNTALLPGVRYMAEMYGASGSVIPRDEADVALVCGEAGSQSTAFAEQGETGSLTLAIPRDCTFQTIVLRNLSRDKDLAIARFTLRRIGSE